MVRLDVWSLFKPFHASLPGTKMSQKINGTGKLFIFHLVHQGVTRVSWSLLKLKSDGRIQLFSSDLFLMGAWSIDRFSQAEEPLKDNVLSLFSFSHHLNSTYKSIVVCKVCQKMFLSHNLPRSPLDTGFPVTTRNLLTFSVDFRIGNLFC